MPRKAKKAKPRKKRSYVPCYWVNRVPARFFPRGPRSLYCYLAAYPSGCCYLFNYRLADKFFVSTRTISRWRSWLSKHRLIHIWWETSRKPRIICHHFTSAKDWLTAMALPTPTKSAPKLHLTAGEKDDRRRAMLRSLFFKQGRTTLSP